MKSEIDSTIVLILNIVYVSIIIISAFVYVIIKMIEAFPMFFIILGGMYLVSMISCFVQMRFKKARKH